MNNMQPGLRCVNTVKETMLGSPLVWRFNRGTFSIAISNGGGTDYTKVITDLGRIETQWLTDANGKELELNGAVELAKVSGVRRPMRVAPVYDDNLGNLVFRFDAVPNQNYTAYFDYQRKSQPLTSPASTFKPIPDEFGYLLQKGVLSECALLVEDSRFTIWRQEWLAGVLATQDGLDAQAKAIFFEQMMNVGRTAQRNAAQGDSGNKGRQV